MEMLFAGTAVQALSGLVGYLVSQGQKAKADEIMRRAREGYENLTPADLKDIAFEVLGPTELSKIATDPAYKKAQDRALSGLQEISNNGGFDVRDQSNLARIRNETSRQAAQQNAALTTSMARRGVGGSGAELALRAEANQAAVGREAQAGLDVAAQARQRYFDSLKASGDMATNLRNQEYGEKANAARAQDAINRFNIENKRDTGMYNNTLAQQRYNNRLGIQDRLTGLDKERAGQIQSRANQLGQVIGGVGNAIGGAMSSYGAGAGGATSGAAADAYGDMTPATKLDEETDEEKYRKAYGGIGSAS